MWILICNKCVSSYSLCNVSIHVMCENITIIVRYCSSVHSSLIAYDLSTQCDVYWRQVDLIGPRCLFWEMTSCNCGWLSE